MATRRRTTVGAMTERQPNIVMIVSDEERRNDWLRGAVDLPAHDRLAADSLSFANHFTHASPCSPSRASLYTGRYLAEHGVVNNVSFPAHTQLDPAQPTIGSLLRDVGYESAYLGKWHLSHDAPPPMTDYGYSGWFGNDKHFTGNAWTGRFFDPVIAETAVAWIREHAHDETPWFLTVALVNPHDIMWFPIDQPGWLDANPEHRRTFEFIQEFVLGGEVAVAAPPIDYPERFDTLPANFADDLSTKPAIQRAWRDVRNTEHFVGSMQDAPESLWLRQLDYYAWLHERLDESLTTILDGLRAAGAYDDTMIVYTSDHGDACGSHGLRAKLPCIYDEVMGVPLTIKPPAGDLAMSSVGATTDALSSHVDVATTIVAAGGGDTDQVSGRDLAPVLADPSASVREAVLFSQESAQSERLAEVRYALRGTFDGRMKYAHYYGVGGGIRRDGTPGESAPEVPVDAPFEDQEHEWYDTVEDPHELHNLANDPARRAQVEALFNQCREFEWSELRSA